MMSNSLHEILHAQIVEGQAAEHAYNIYVRKYIEQERNYLLNKFEDSPEDVESLLRIKQELACLNNLKGSILAAIQRGLAAEQEINK